ncbi:MAG: 16S rRNA (uracil(1498)-N(3))-methyltransferase [Lachnospiraceae bacterium]|nr:16S rRNA (uracil(1498)-N(3))-methyltransferase [Lachnospiraceae bacterium]
MYHFFVSPEQIGENEIRIEGPDVNHIKNVLRMHPGEEVRLCTGQDTKDYRCEIAQVGDTYVLAKIRWVEENGTELSSRLYLFQGLPKSDKMELIIQKAVELGVYEIIPVAAKRAVVKLDAKKEETKRKRWNAISESAAKQSKRMVIPKVTKVMSFAEAVAYAEDACDVRLIPYERAENMDRTRELLSALQPGQSVGIFIGPEGGFEDTEVEAAMEHGMQAITLGRRILRTETAGLAVLSALMFQLESR